MHGYQLSKRLADTLGGFWKVSYGSLYPALRRLESEGAVEPVFPKDDVGRRKNVYRITAKGEALFAELLQEAAPESSEDNRFRVRLAFFRYLKPETRLRLLEKRRAYLEDRLSDIKTVAQELPRADRRLHAVADAARRGGHRAGHRLARRPDRDGTAPGARRRRDRGRLVVVAVDGGRPPGVSRRPTAAASQADAEEPSAAPGRKPRARRRAGPPRPRPSRRPPPTVSAPGPAHPAGPLPPFARRSVPREEDPSRHRRRGELLLVAGAGPRVLQGRLARAACARPHARPARRLPRVRRRGRGRVRRGRQEGRQGRVRGDLHRAEQHHPVRRRAADSASRSSAAPTLDGLGKYYRETIDESDAQPVDVAAALREAEADVVVSYLPVGSEEATKFYAQAAIDAGAGFVNCMPVFIASNAGMGAQVRRGRACRSSATTSRARSAPRSSTASSPSSSRTAASSSTGPTS